MNYNSDVIKACVESWDIFLQNFYNDSHSDCATVQGGLNGHGFPFRMAQTNPMYEKGISYMLLTIGIQKHIQALHCELYDEAEEIFGDIQAGSNVHQMLSSDSDPWLEAEKYYLLALELDEKCAGACYGLGVLRSRQGRDKDAFELFNRAQAAYPAYKTYCCIQKANLLEPQDYDSALEEYCKAFLGSVQAGQYLKEIGRALWAHGIREEALQMFEHSIDPHHLYPAEFIIFPNPKTEIRDVWENASNHLDEK